MNLPTFSPGDDPGPDFARLVRNSGRRAPSDTGTSSIVWALTAAGDAEIRGVA